MAETRVIRYRTHADRAEENATLIAAVFAELADTRPPGLQYAAHRLEDGVSFVHVVTTDGPDNPLFASPAFAAFQAGIGERCADGPAAATSTIVGSYTG